MSESPRRPGTGSVSRGPVTTVALIGVIAVIVFAGLVLLRLPKADDIETQKVRFAAATFTGLLLVFVFAAVLYFSDSRSDGANAGKDVFEKAMTAMTPLIGVVVGDLFGTKDKLTGSAASLVRRSPRTMAPKTKGPCRDTRLSVQVRRLVAVNSLCTYAALVTIDQQACPP